MRVPLIDGQGISAQGTAICRRRCYRILLTKIAQALLDDSDKDTVDSGKLRRPRPRADGSAGEVSEPVVNGAGGSVGIGDHTFSQNNLGEVIRRPGGR